MGNHQAALNSHSSSVTLSSGQPLEQLANLGLSHEELKLIKSQLKETRRKHLTNDHKLLINSKLSSVTSSIKMFKCAYHKAIKEHKSFIQELSEMKNMPIRLMMIATIGLLASCFIVGLMQALSDQLALLLGFVTLIFSTLEYWFRKGILETYLLEWTKKRSRFKFIKDIPSTEEVSVYLIELEQQIRNEIQIRKKSIKQFQNLSSIVEHWEAFLKQYPQKNLITNSKNDFNLDKESLIKDFTYHLKLSLMHSIHDLMEQTAQLSKVEIVNALEYQEVKKQVECRIWSIWLSEQSEGLIRHIKSDRMTNKKYINLLRQRLVDNLCFGWEDSDKGVHGKGGFKESSHCLTGSYHTTKVYMDFVVDRFISEQSNNA